MGQQLHQGDKAAIRDLTEVAIANGSSVSELRQLRAELADSLGVSRRSLGSVSAYVEYSATEAIDELGLRSRLSNGELITAARLVRGSGTPLEDLRVLADDIGLTPGELSAVIDRYEALYQKRPDGGLDAQVGTANASVVPPGSGTDQSEATVTAVAPPPSQPDDPLPGSSACPGPAKPSALEELPSEIVGPARDPLVTGLSDTADSDLDPDTGISGDKANYDFPAKHEWRQVWADYIRSEFGPARLRDALVVCLPGRAVEPEVSKYLALGVRPENIYCVEGSARVRDEFLANAQRLGVKPLTEPLEKALVRLGEKGLRFDIANFDFHGPQSRGHRRALDALPRASDSIVVYNALGKRDPKQVTSKAFVSAARDEASTAEVRDLLLNGDSAPEAKRLLRYIGAKSNDPSVNNDVSTVAGLRRGYTSSLWLTYSGDRWRPYDRELMVSLVKCAFDVNSTWEPPRDVGDRAIRAQISDLFHAYRRIAPLKVTELVRGFEYVYPTKLFRGCDPVHLGLAIWHSTFSVDYKVGDMLTWEYLSESNKGKTRSPFCTAYGRLLRHDAALPVHKSVMHFCAEYTRLVARNKLGPEPEAERAFKVRVTESSGLVRRHRTPLQWNDRIELLGRV